MKALERSISVVCNAIDNIVNTTQNIEQIATLSSSVETLAKCYCMMKDIELHEKYHLSAMNELPGETKPDLDPMN